MKKSKFFFITAICYQITISLSATEILCDSMPSEQSCSEPAVPLSRITFHFPNWVDYVKLDISEEFQSQKFTLDGSGQKQFFTRNDWAGRETSYVEARIDFCPQLLICSSKEQCNLLSSQIRGVRVVTKKALCTVRCAMQSVSYKDNRRIYMREFSIEPYMNSISNGHLSIYPLLHEENDSFYLAPVSMGDMKIILSDPDHSAHHHILVVNRIN